MGGMNARIAAGAISFLYMVWSDYAKEGRRNIPVKAYLTCIFFTVEDLSSLISVEILLTRCALNPEREGSNMIPISFHSYRPRLSANALLCSTTNSIMISNFTMPLMKQFKQYTPRYAFQISGASGKKREEEKNRSLLQKQMQNIQSHISEIEHIYTGIRGIRHDLNNHIHVIGTLLEQKRYQDAENYLETMQGIVDTFEFAVKTGNPVTDIIINEKQREAEQKGIDFRSDFHYVQEGGLNVFDISVILNNALENAFEASCRSKDAYVSLYSERKKNVYLITVKNSYDGQLLMGTDDLPESMKDDRELHGFGLKNIRAVAEKYFGMFCICFCNNERFFSSSRFFLRFWERKTSANIITSVII